MTQRSYRTRIYSAYTRLHAPTIQQRTTADLDYIARPLLARLDDWLPMCREALCLDVACGSGNLLYALDKAGYQNIFGVDASPPQAAVAKALYPQVEQGDAIEYLRQRTEKFDLITAFDLIEHFDKEELFIFLDAVHGALKPGGRVIIQTPNADSPCFGSVRYGDLTHEVAFTPSSLGHALELTGFVQYAAREIPPFIHGFKSSIRSVLWRVLRWFVLTYNLIETGSKGSGIVTRVFIAKADKPL